MAKALLVVPKEHFSVSQYRRTRQLLEQEGFSVQVAAPSREQIRLTDFSLTPDLAISEAKAADYDLVVFIAGRGNKELWHAPEAHRLARESLAAGKVVGASGAAVAILANAGLLQGRLVTGPISLAALLKDKGANYTAGPVAVDDGLVTLRKSEAFAFFVQALLDQLRRRVAEQKVA